MIPLNYTIRMRPILDKQNFKTLERFAAPSSVTIRVKSITNGSCNSIQLHQKNLTIHQTLVSVRNLATQKNLTILQHAFDYGRDFYTIVLLEPFELGDELELHIPYIVHLSQSSWLGNLGSYFDPVGSKDVVLSATKLEPHHARKVFPVFDEPSLKARFKIIIGRLDGKYHSLSNMEIEKIEPE